VQARRQAAAFGERPALGMRGADALHRSGCGARDARGDCQSSASVRPGCRAKNAPSSAWRQHAWRTFDATPATTTWAAREVTLYLALASSLPSYRSSALPQRSHRPFSAEPDLVRRRPSRTSRSESTNWWTACTTKDRNAYRPTGAARTAEPFAVNSRGDGRDDPQAHD
jgi:hypothetical protein